MRRPIAGIAARKRGDRGPLTHRLTPRSYFSPQTLADAIDHFTRAQATTLTTTTVTLTAGHLDVDGDANDPATGDFAVQGGLILSDGTRSHCARITSISIPLNRITFTPSLPTSAASWVTAQIRAVPAVIYEIGSSCGAGLTRNCQLLSNRGEERGREKGQ